MLNWLVIGIGDISTRRVIPAIQSEARSTLYWGCKQKQGFRRSGVE